MPAANPAPISAYPYISLHGRDPNHFLAGSRWGHHDQAAGIVALVGDNHAAPERKAESHREETYFHSDAMRHNGNHEMQP